MSLLDKFSNDQFLPSDVELAIKKETIPLINRSFDERVDALLHHGRIFWDKDHTNALEQALAYAGDDGLVATLPEIVALISRAERSSSIWRSWYTPHTEENIGIDTKGIFYGPDASVLVVVHGGGLLTPQRVRNAHAQDSRSERILYLKEEFDALLEGKLADGTHLPLYKFEQMQNAIQLPHHFGVVMPYATALKVTPGWHKQEAFLRDAMVRIRTAGAHDYVSSYFETAKRDFGAVGCWHKLKELVSDPQGNMLFFFSDHNGLYENTSLGYLAQFIGVRP